MTLMGMVSNRTEDTLDSSPFFSSVSGFMWTVLLLVLSALALFAPDTRTAFVVLIVCGSGYFGSSVLVT